MQPLSLTSKAVESTALSLQGIHHIKSSDCLAASVLCICDGIPDDVLEEDLKANKGKQSKH